MGENDVYMVIMVSVRFSGMGGVLELAWEDIKSHGIMKMHDMT